MNKQSRLLVLERSDDERKSSKHGPKLRVLCTHANKGKVYPYNSRKRGWK